MQPNQNQTPTENQPMNAGPQAVTGTGSDAPPPITNDDLKKVVGFGGTVKMNEVTPLQVESVAQEIHTSKIVKFGGGFLVFFWAVVAVGVFKIPGLIGAIITLTGITVSYKIYKKTKSPLAWRALLLFIGIIVAFLMWARFSRS